jgi:hypothetical protein
MACKICRESRGTGLLDTRYKEIDSSRRHAP